MADTIDIKIGDDVVRVPGWATEETAKQMAKFNSASAKALTELVRQSGKGQKLVLENQKIFQELKTATKKDKDESVKAETKLNKFRKEHAKVLQTTTNTMKNASKGLLNAFNKDNLTGIATAIGGIVGLGAIAGFTVGVLEKFAANVSSLSNVGIGLGTSLVDLRNQATLTGLNIEDYGKLVMTQGSALRSLGTSAQDGARIFSALSREARFAAREFNNFGLTNAEYNEYLLEEIEIRRKAGIGQDQITNNLSGSMNRLLAETTAMAAMTGQDRREMMRRRQEMANDASMMAFKMSLEDGADLVSKNLDSVATSFGAGGDIGSQFGLAIAQSFRTGIDFRALNQDLAKMSALSPSVGIMMDEIATFVRQNAESMGTEEFAATLVTMLAQLGKAIPSEEMSQLGLFAAVGNEEAANLIRFTSELQGLETELQKNIETQQDALQGLRDTDLLALASTVEEMTNRIQDSALTSILETLGLDVNAAGGELVEAIQNIADHFGPDHTLWSGMKSSYGELTTAMDNFKHALIAGGAAIALLSMTSGGRGLLGRLGRGVGKVGGGILRGGVAAATATAPVAKSVATSAATRAPGILSRFISGVSKLGRLTPVGVGVTAALTPSELGDGTSTAQFDKENPFPENGTPSEISDWQRRREEFANRPITGIVQEDIDAEYERIARERHSALNPPFEQRSFFEQQEMRMSTPGSRGTLDAMRASGAPLDAETHAVLTGRPIPGREDWQQRLIDSNREVVEEMRKTRRAIEDSR